MNLDLHIAKTPIAEAGMPRFCAVATQRISEAILIPGAGPAAGLTDQSLVIEQFARNEGDCVAGLTTDMQYRPAREVLTEIVDGDPMAWMGDSFRLQDA